MSKYGILDEAFNLKNPQTLFNSVTLGEVVDTNDPQQMGRLRILCPALGDTPDKKIKDIPWAMFSSPIAGVLESGSRGREDDTTNGPVAYGMWNIPKVGAHVVVTCIDGNPRFRIWMGCIYDQFLTHTLPHGRYSYQDTLEGDPSGPLSSSEQPIEPLHSKQSEAFGNRNNFEYRTRGADFTAAYLDEQFIQTPESKVSNNPDDRNIEFVELDGEKIASNQGYAQSRIEPDLQFESTGKNYDSQTYSWTTPGFHSVSMDDRPENCRMRFRTTHGHQIILDDTNERIYVSTASGKTWIEIDEKGTIDIFADDDISLHAKGDINFTTEKSFRVRAKEDIHMSADGDVRAYAKKDIHFKSDLDSFWQSGSTIHIKSTGEINQESGGQMNMKAGGNILMTASSDIHLNGPPARSASNAVNARSTTRTPKHEPWARTHKSDDSQLSFDDEQQSVEYTYNDKNIGRKSDLYGKDYTRNDKWHR